MIIATIPDLSLQYDEALGLLRVEWCSGQDMRTFRASATQLLLLLRQLDVRNMLLEMNTFPDISVYDQVWLGTNWMPVLVKLPLERVQLAIDSLLALSRPFIKFDIQFFAASLPGLHWLSDYSDRLPALLAEWEARFGPAPLPLTGTAEPRPFYGLLL